jgi:hypothetical protein
MAKTKNTAKTVTLTEAELEARIDAAAAKKIADRDSAARDAREAVKKAKNTPNVCHPVPITDNDKANNVLARCVFYVPNVGKITGTAVMVRHDGVLKVRYGLAINAIFAIPGDTATDAEELIDSINAKAKHGPECLAYLVKAYTAAAKSHPFAERKKAE